MSLRLPLLSVALFAAGCGGKGDDKAAPNLDEGQKVAVVVSEINDFSPPMATKYFTADAKPNAATMKKLGSMSFAVEGKPKVDGNTATATVKMWQQAGNKDFGSKEWEFVKEGEQWKIKAAPLP